LHTLSFLSPSVFSHKTLTPVRLQMGHVPRQPFIDLTSLPRFGLGIEILLWLR
jgi:hypothetical protein